MKLTPAQSSAIDYIGRQRREPPKFGAKTRCSTRTMKQLLGVGLVDIVESDRVILTPSGWREFFRMHPRSKLKTGEDFTYDKQR